MQVQQRSVDYRVDFLGGEGRGVSFKYTRSYVRSHDFSQAEDGDIAADIEKDDGGRSSSNGNGAIGVGKEGESNDFVQELGFAGARGSAGEF